MRLIDDYPGETPGGKYKVAHIFFTARKHSFIYKDFALPFLCSSADMENNQEYTLISFSSGGSSIQQAQAITSFQTHQNTQGTLH